MLGGGRGWVRGGDAHVLLMQVRAEEPRHAFEVDMDFGAVLFYVYERV